jgi:DNA-binding SARP family transcriptional activator/tetratricopeptide (TPR) repeat protein
MLKLQLFGGLSLVGDAAVPERALQRRRLALLAILALAGRRGISRERVQSHLWPESRPDRGRHALDQLLYTTRRDLGRDVILSGTTDLRLNPAVLRPDIWVFAEAVESARWSEAVELYEGPLLHGFHLADDTEFEQWLDSERARFDQEFHRALETLARDASESGDHLAAVRWWRRRAASEPVSARVALELMHALVTAGDRAGAIRHAHVHQELVRSTLELEPDPAVGALASTIAASSGAQPGAVAPTRIVALAPATVEQPAIRDAAAPAAGAPRRHWSSRRVAAAGAGVAALGFVTAALLVRGAAPATVAEPALAASGAASNRTAVVTNALHGTRDDGALALYLRGRTEWEKRTRDGLQESVVLFRRATERDPTYAAAWAGLGQSYAMLGYFGFAPGDAMFPKARAAALHALELDPAAGEAYAALGQALAWRHAWNEAEQAYLRALELRPEDATAHQWYALLLAYLGRVPEAVRHTGHASRLEPLSVQINNFHGILLYYSGDLEGALRQYERTVDAEPDSAWVRQNPWVLSNFGHVAAAAGRHEQAVRLIERALHVVPTHPRPLLDLARVYVLAADPDRARAVFARADTTHAHYAVYRALLHVLLDEFDDAFAWFDRVGEWPLPSLVGLNSNPRYAALRADPRFQQIRKRLGMPPLSAPEPLQ